MRKIPTGWHLATWTTYATFLITITHSKLFDKCSLARTLIYQHFLDLEQVQTWVCIASHQSNFNTAIVNYDTNGIGYHGMYQISDKYWCGPGNVCNLDCDRLRDDDLHDDFECISHIFAEHSRLSGNGYNAWTTYDRFCASGRAPSVDECFVNNVRKVITTKKPRVEVIDKVYDRCELARELRFVHGLPSKQIATWVCIAKHESNFRTSVVGRLNADGSGDHGLFQISDIYWCSPPGNGWACGVTCAELTDSDITDDVKCIQVIHAEHERLSGDGFNAWAVYQPYCKYRSEQYTDGCFAPGELERTPNVVEVEHKPTGKVYSRCELALELRDRHFIPNEQIATWVCIAYHESRFNTTAEGRLNADGSGDHGLFQISDIYWCSPPGLGWACGISCDALKDNDITDDVGCMRKIYEEHQRLSGDGFNAWSVYQPYCQGQSAEYVRGCFDQASGVHNQNAIDDYETPRKPSVTPSAAPKASSGKVYDRCELARELRYVHRIPRDQVATWVCIAKHESHFNTSAVGRLNADGSVDHGLFQISDIYWCSGSYPGLGWSCGLSCSQLEDSDITDDVKCIRKIHDEHIKLSGDGFNAWTVYAPYCKDRSSQYSDGCFDEPAIPWEDENEIDFSRTQVVPHFVPKEKGKVYERCELANELLFKYHIPKEQIPTWMCIVEYESHFNTSAVGRKNADGSADHGLFQISDLFWCSPTGKGGACQVSCADLENNDISDDVKCIRMIWEEHRGLSGDGFNAWAVYPLYCNNGRSDRYLDGCSTSIEASSVRPSSTTIASTRKTTTTKQSHYGNGLFSTSTSRTTTQRSTSTTVRTTPWWKTTVPKPETTVSTKSPLTLSSGHWNDQWKTTYPIEKTTTKIVYPTEATKKALSTTKLPLTQTSTPRSSSTNTLITTQNPPSTISSKFELWFNAFTTKKPVTIYQFSSFNPSLTTTVKPTTIWQLSSTYSTTKKPTIQTQKPQSSQAEKPKISTHRPNRTKASSTLTTILNSNDTESNNNRTTSQNTDTNYLNTFTLSHLSSIPQNGYLWPSPSTQRPRSTSSSSSSSSSFPSRATSVIATNLHSKHSQQQEQHKQQQPTPLTTTITQQPSTTRASKPFTLDRQKTTSRPSSRTIDITSQYPPTTTPTPSTTTTTPKPIITTNNVEATAQAILDKQTITKMAFDRLFDMFKH